MGIVADNIKSAMKKAGVSQRELEEKTGIPHSAIQRYAAGATDRIPISRLEKIADALGTTAALLLGWDDLPSDILPPPATKRVPLVGKIACGDPIEAIEDYDEFAEAPESVHCDFALRCEGDSMKDARILDGDIVYIRRQPQVETGQIAAVMIDGETTLKKVYYQDNGIVLMPANPNYAPIVLNESVIAPDYVKILGLAVGFTSTNI